MEKKSGGRNLYFAAFAISVLLWLLLQLTGISQLAFVKEPQGHPIWLYRFLHLPFLWVFIFRILYLYQHRKEDDIRHSIILSAVFFIIAGGIFLCVYPGTWSWDDVFIFTSAVNYDLNAWQHILTSIFHILCLETVPVAGGVPFIQVIIASLIAGYVSVMLANSINRKTLLSARAQRLLEVLVLLPLLSPPLLSYLYSGFRMGICPYLELLLCVMFIYYAKHKIAVHNMVWICLLTTLVSSWRSENIYYVGLFLLFVIYKWRGSKDWKPAIAFLLVTSCTLLTGGLNKSMIETSDYAVIATLVPMKAMIDKGALTNSERKTVNQVLKVKMMREYASFSAEELYFIPEGIVRRDYSGDDWRHYKKVYAISLIRHPVIALESMWGVFWKASGMSFDNGMTRQRTTFSNTSGGSLSLYDNIQSHSTSFLSVNVPLKYPINDALRSRVIMLLQGTNEQCHYGLFYGLFWNLCISLILAFFAMYYGIKNRDAVTVVILLSVFARFMVVFATAIAPYVMYYLSAMLLSNIVFVYSAAVYICGSVTEDCKKAVLAT